MTKIPNNTHAERSVVLSYLRSVLVGLEKLNVVLYAMKPAVAVQQPRFCLLQTFAGVLLLGA